MSPGEVKLELAFGDALVTFGVRVVGNGVCVCATDKLKENRISADARVEPRANTILFFLPKVKLFTSLKDRKDMRLNFCCSA